MGIKPGSRLKSVTDTTEVVVVRAGDESIEISCGGKPMVAHDAEGAAADATPAAGFDAGTLVGKRYEHVDSGLELLCTKPGSASLSVGDALLTLKEAKPLPSSD